MHMQSLFSALLKDNVETTQNPLPHSKVMERVCAAMVATPHGAQMAIQHVIYAQFLVCTAMVYGMIVSMVYNI